MRGQKLVFVKCGTVIAALLLVVGAGCATAWAAAELPPAKPLVVPVLPYQKYTLPNGLEVILHENHKLPLVAVDLWYHVGPVNEKAGRTGFAHLFEHMMFEGSEHVGEKAHFKYLEGAGATDINGTTNYDRTNYFETLPSNQLELALWLESDRMGFLLETLDRTKLTNQRDVVRNERRQGEGSPYDLADEEVGHLLFPKRHPYYGNVIGSHADIEAARLNDVRDFFQHYYTPNNASIAIAGDFDRAKVKAMVAKYLRADSARAGGREAGRGDAADRERAAGDGDGYGTTAAVIGGVADAGGVQAGDADADMFIGCWAAARSAAYTGSWCMRSRWRRA